MTFVFVVQFKFETIAVFFCAFSNRKMQTLLYQVWEMCELESKRSGFSAFQCQRQCYRSLNRRSRENWRKQQCKSCVKIFKYYFPTGHAARARYREPGSCTEEFLFACLSSFCFIYLIGIWLVFMNILDVHVIRNLNLRLLRRGVGSMYYIHTRFPKLCSSYLCRKNSWRQ